jgi:hypothetical protein
MRALLAAFRKGDRKEMEEVRSFFVSLAAVVVFVKGGWKGGWGGVGLPKAGLSIDSDRSLLSQRQTTLLGAPIVFLEHNAPMYLCIIPPPQTTQKQHLSLTHTSIYT